MFSCEHAGLRPYFKQFEAELLHVLARLDNPRQVMEYLAVMKLASQDCADTFGVERKKK